jgi:hypothetical protein
MKRTIIGNHVTTHVCVKGVLLILSLLLIAYFQRLTIIH